MQIRGVSNVATRDNLRKDFFCNEWKKKRDGFCNPCYDLELEPLEIHSGHAQ